MGIAIVAVFTVLAFAIWYYSPSQRLLRTLRAAPQLPIGQVAEGTRARVTGQVGAWQGTVQAPLSGRPCVYYEVTIEKRTGGKNQRWRQIAREAAGVPFLVQDGTGRAIVDPTHAQILVRFDANSRSGTFDDPTPAEHALLARHQLSGQGLLFNKTLRYAEGVIEPGETITVLGSGVREPDPDAVADAGGYRDGPPTRLRIAGTPEHPLQLTDRTDRV